MMQDAKILICYNSPVSVFSVYNGKPAEDTESEKDLSEKSFLKELSKVNHSLSKYFSEVKSLPVDRNIRHMINKINSFDPDVIYNFVESVEGISSFEWCVAGTFDLLGYEYTGSGPMTLGNCLNKARTKNILKARGINTPNHIVLKFQKRFTQEDITLSYPVIMKPISEDGSIGISELSVVDNYRQLRKQFGFLVNVYKQDILVEEYIEGRELNAAVLGGKILPISEICFDTLPDGLPKIVTYDGKWMEGSTYYENTKPVCPANLDDETKSEIEKTALAAYEAINCRDYARVDIRLSKKGVHYVIEVNPNPDISSDSGFARAAAAKGMSHEELLSTIANFALNRKKKKKSDTQAKAV
jgi:D-alanine-D-alanine ligase